MAEKYVNIDETSVLAPSHAWHEVSKAPARHLPELQRGARHHGRDHGWRRDDAVSASGPRRSPPVLADGAVAARPRRGRRADQRHGRAAADPGHAPGAAAVAGDAAPDPGRALASAIPAAGLDVPRQSGGKRLRPAVGSPPAGDLERQAFDPRHAPREPAQRGASSASAPRCRRRRCAIIYNSRLSASQHERLGLRFRQDGGDSQRLRLPGCSGRARRWRSGCASEASIDAGRVVIGMVARNHPQKDPGNLDQGDRAAGRRGDRRPCRDRRHRLRHRATPRSCSAIGQAGVAGSHLAARRAPRHSRHRRRTRHRDAAIGLGRRLSERPRRGDGLRRALRHHRHRRQCLDRRRCRDRGAAARPGGPRRRARPPRRARCTKGADSSALRPVHASSSISRSTTSSAGTRSCTSAAATPSVRRDVPDGSICREVADAEVTRLADGGSTR